MIRKENEIKKQLKDIHRKFEDPLDSDYVYGYISALRWVLKQE